MFTYKFYVNLSKNNTLMLRITNNRKKSELSLGFRISEQEFADILSGHPSQKNGSLASLIAVWRGKVEQIKFDLCKNGNVAEDPKAIRDTINASLFGIKTNKPEVTEDVGSFISFFKTHMEAYTNRSTRESNQYTLSCMQRYCQSSGSGQNIEKMSLEDINYAWLSDFETWMSKQGLSQNTRKIHFGNIRAAMRDACKRELTDNDPFRRFTFRPAKTRKRSLPVSMLRDLFEYPVEPFAEIYRDMFMLSFMLLGINMVDLYNLKELTNQGRIEYTRSKTDGLFSVKVEPEAMAIIERYKGEKGLLSIADRWSDHRNFRHQMNSAIKRIGKARGKGRRDGEGNGPFAEVTSYWARHSWATAAYEIGVPDDVISQALGHQGTGARVTEVYILRSMDKIDEANRRVLDWVLYGKR